MMTDHKFMARVYLAQAVHFRQHRAFHALLLAWAANRRRAAQPKQGRLF